MTTTDLISIAKATARAHGLDEQLVCAVCDHESRWNTWAFRPEPEFKERYVDSIPSITMDERWGRAISWGLMQLMGQTARELGYKEPYLTELCEPVVGLEYGCRKLDKCIAKNPGNLRGALLMYNGGGNPSYPDLVTPLMGLYK